MPASFASIALSVSLLAQATTTAPVPSDGPDLTSLIARLSADETGDRDAAQQAILALPDDPTAALRAARAKTSDPDARMRIDALLVQTRERAELGASRITLKFTDEPLSKVLDEFERQSRARFNELGEASDPQTRVTIDVRDVTFWEAVTKLQQAGNCVFNPNTGNDSGWRVTRNGGQQSFIRGVESGAFLFQPTSATYNRSVNYGPNMGADRESFVFQMSMLAEPKIRLGEQSAQVVLERARDANGNDLLPTGRNQLGAGVSQSMVNCGMQLTYPKQNAADKIAEISGVVRLAVASRVLTIESDDLLGGRIERQLEGGVRLTIEASRPGNATPPNPGDARIDLNINVERANAAGGPTADQLQRALARTRITDPLGAPMQQAGFNSINADGNRQTYRVSFVPTQNQPRRPDGSLASPADGAYRLRVELPIGFRPVEIPFRFTDLKMP